MFGVVPNEAVHSATGFSIPESCCQGINKIQLRPLLARYLAAWRQLRGRRPLRATGRVQRRQLLFVPRAFGRKEREQDKLMAELLHNRMEVMAELQSFPNSGRAVPVHPARVSIKVCSYRVTHYQKIC